MVYTCLTPPFVAAQVPQVSITFGSVAVPLHVGVRAVQQRVGGVGELAREGQGHADLDGLLRLGSESETDRRNGDGDAHHVSLLLGSRTIPKMKRSSEKILTTHVGSLPLLDGSSVEAVVRKQRELGLDLINEGEYTKGGDWLSYVEQRFGGFEPRPPAPGAIPLIAQGKDRQSCAG